MMSRNRLHDLMIMTYALAAGNGNVDMTETRTISEKERRRQEALRMQKKGLKKFIIDGEEVWALNEKNAIRKKTKHNG